MGRPGWLAFEPLSADIGGCRELLGPDTMSSLLLRNGNVRSGSRSRYGKPSKLGFRNQPPGLLLLL